MYRLIVIMFILHLWWMRWRSSNNDLLAVGDLVKLRSFTNFSLITENDHIITSNYLKWETFTSVCIANSLTTGKEWYRCYYFEVIAFLLDGCLSSNLSCRLLCFVYGRLRFVVTSTTNSTQWRIPRVDVIEDARRANSAHNFSCGGVKRSSAHPKISVASNHTTVALL